MALRIVIIKMRRGLKGKINENSKPYAFICPIKDIEKGDYVVVEVTRKTFRRNRTNDFRVGRVEEIMSWDDATILKYRPNSFVALDSDGTLHFERIKDYDSKKTSWL